MSSDGPSWATYRSCVCRDACRLGECRFRRMCRRMVVPAWPVLAWTRSHTWLTSHRPLPPSSSSDGGRCQASGSVRWPVSATWQMSSPLVCQTCSVPPPSVWRTVLAASSLTASTKSGVRDGVSPAHAACWRRSCEPGAGRQSSPASRRARAGGTEPGYIAAERPAAPGS